MNPHARDPRGGRHAKELSTGVQTQGPGPDRSGRTVAAISADLGVSDQTIYSWRNQDQVDRGQRPGVTSSEQRAG